jgi:hypothetical protein
MFQIHAISINGGTPSVTSKTFETEEKWDICLKFIKQKDWQILNNLFHEKLKCLISLITQALLNIFISFMKMKISILSWNMCKQAI